MPSMKYLALFTKGESARWLGHLDLLRTFERAIRRAELPIAFTTGFNPREKLSFASALAVGVTGDAEPMTIELSSEIAPEVLTSRLNAKLPVGIQIVAAAEIPDAGSRDLMNAYTCAVLSVVCDADANMTLQEAATAVDALLAAPSAQVVREREGRKKEIDIRPMIRSLWCESLLSQRLQLHMELTIGNDGNAKPQEIVEVLSRTLSGLRVRRVHRLRLTGLDAPNLLQGNPQEA